MSCSKQNLLTMLLLAVVFTGCRQQETANTTASNSQSSAVDSKSVSKIEGWGGWELNGMTAANEDDVRQWAEELEASTVNVDEERFFELVNMEPLHDYATSLVDHVEFKNGFKRGARSKLPTFFAQLSRNGATYRFIGMRETQRGQLGPMFRLMDSGGACNYHHWDLMKDASGKVLGLDMYIFLTGEYFSETMQRLAALSAPDSSNFLAKLMGKNKVNKQEQNLLMKFFEAQGKSDFAAVQSTYKQLPEKLQKEKAFSLVRMMAAMNTSDEDYLRAIEEHRQKFPRDPSADLIELDLHFVRKDYAKAYRALDRLDEFIGRDAHLVNYRGSIAYEESKLDEAKKLFQEVIEIDPYYENGYWSLNTVYVDLKDYDGSLVTLKKLIDSFEGIVFDFSDPFFGEWVKSPQHEELMEYQKNN